jgi:choline transport protein
MLLSTIALGSYVAFSNVVNLSIGGLYASYFIVCTLLLWRRVQGISPYNARCAVVGPETLTWYVTSMYELHVRHILTSYTNL